LLRRRLMPLLGHLLLSELGCRISTFFHTGHSRKTLADNTTIARGLIIFKSLSRDTAALHVYETHDRTSSSVGGISTSSRRVYTGHTVTAKQGLSFTRKKSKSIVWSSSFLRITSKIDSTPAYAREEVRATARREILTPWRAKWLCAARGQLRGRAVIARHQRTPRAENNNSMTRVRPVIISKYERFLTYVFRAKSRDANRPANLFRVR